MHHSAAPGPAWFPDGRLITLRHETAASSGLVQAQIWQVLPTRQPMLTLQSSFELPLAAVEFDDLQIIANRFLLFRAWGEANLNGWLARLLGWFPITSPITMMMRLATGKVPLWDLLLAIACLAAGVLVAVRSAAALFRLGLLMYGKRPTLGEILRHLRHA